MVVTSTPAGKIVKLVVRLVLRGAPLHKAETLPFANSTVKPNSNGRFPGSRFLISIQNFGRAPSGDWNMAPFALLPRRAESVMGRPFTNSTPASLSTLLIVTVDLLKSPISPLYVNSPLEMVTLVFVVPNFSALPSSLVTITPESFGTLASVAQFGCEHKVARISVSRPLMTPSLLRSRGSPGPFESLRLQRSRWRKSVRGCSPSSAWTSPVNCARV